MGDGVDEVVVADVDVFVGGVIGVGSGDIGGDFKCSGFGMGVGFSAECETTMCLGLRGLSFLTIFCLTFPLTDGSGVLPLLMDPLRC